MIGFSSSGVIALALAATYPGLVTEVIAWEPPALSVLPGADELHEMMAGPMLAHLAASPQDWTGAYDVMLNSISGGQVDLHDPVVAAMRRNAEAAVRDDAQVITRHRFLPSELSGAPAVVAVGASPAELPGHGGRPSARGAGGGHRRVHSRLNR